MASRVRPELIDDLMDAYVDWREECFALRDAYDRWSRGTAADERSLAFAAYRAALDREEHASSIYAARTRRAADELATKRSALRTLRSFVSSV